MIDTLKRDFAKAKDKIDRLVIHRKEERIRTGIKKKKKGEREG